MFKKSFTVQDLEANKIKLTDAYGKKHFTFNVKASEFEPSANVEVLRNMLSNYLSVGGSFISTLPYIEVFKGWAYPVFTNLNPADVIVRIYGELTTDNKAIAFYNWSVDDWVTPVRKTWDKLIANVVVKHSDFPAFMDGIKLYAVEPKMGKLVWTISDISNKFRVEGMRNVVGIATSYDKMNVMSMGDWACDIIVNNKPYVLTFTSENPGTGMKGEKDIPVVGVFDKEKGIYYKRRA